LRIFCQNCDVTLISQRNKMDVHQNGRRAVEGNSGGQTGLEKHDGRERLSSGGGLTLTQRISPLHLRRDGPFADVDLKGPCCLTGEKSLLGHGHPQCPPGAFWSLVSRGDRVLSSGKSRKGSRSDQRRVFRLAPRGSDYIDGGTYGLRKVRAFGKRPCPTRPDLRIRHERLLAPIGHATR